MKIAAINNQNFEAKKFRLPVNRINCSMPEAGVFGPKLSVCMAKEYNNPNAKNIYKQIKVTSDVKKKMELYEQMGDYNIVNYGSGILGRIKRALNIPEKTNFPRIK